MPKEIQCTFSVDVDAVAGFIGSWGGADSLYDIQRGIFSVEVGTPRVLKLFDRMNIKGTWFIPGHTVESFPDHIRMIADAGHEIGAHGYSHEPPNGLTREQEEDVLRKSVEVIEAHTGKRPRGYSAPWWEPSGHTFDLAVKHGFVYGHTQAYHDFLPFYARTGESWTTIDHSRKAEEWMKPLVHGKDIDFVEIPTNWYIDDLPPLMFIKKAPNSGGWFNPRDIEELWRDQFDWVYREMDYAVFPLTIHPDVAGRPQFLLVLERLIAHINAHPGVRWMTMEDIAADFRQRQPFQGR